MPNAKERGGGNYSREDSPEVLAVAKKQMHGELSDLRNEKIKMMKGLLKDLAAEYQAEALDMEEFSNLIKSMKLIINEYAGGAAKDGDKQKVPSDVDTYLFTVKGKSVQVKLLSHNHGVYTLQGHAENDVELNKQLIVLFNKLLVS